MKKLSSSNLLFLKSKSKLAYGLKGENTGYYHPWKEFNTFQKRAVKIPKNFRKVKAPKASWIKKYIANPKSKRLTKPVNFKAYERVHYEIIDNRSTPYIVYVSSDKKTVSIYRIPENRYVCNKDWSRNRSSNYGYFTKLVKKFRNVRDVFPGVDYKEGMTGNSVLLRINSNTYVYIGDCIYSFRSDDKITRYFSNMGNNLVPYPVAVTKSNVYFMLDKVCVSMAEFADINFSKHKKVADIYTEFYKGGDSIKKKKMQNSKVIKRRLI